MINTINLDGVKHPIKFTINALVDLEEILGENPLPLLASPDVNKPSVMRAVAYCGIKGGYDFKKEECPVTLEDIGNIMTFETMGDVVDVFAKDMDMDTGKKLEVVEKEKEKE